MTKFHIHIGIKLNSLLFPEMCIYTTDWVENKGTTKSSSRIYAVVSLLFLIEEYFLERDVTASKRIFPKLLKPKRLLRATSEVETYNLLIPGSTHTAAWDDKEINRRSKDPER